MLDRIRRDLATPGDGENLGAGGRAGPALAPAGRGARLRRHLAEFTVHSWHAPTHSRHGSPKR